MEIKLLDFSSPLWDVYKGAYGSVKEEIELLMKHKPIYTQMKLRRLDARPQDDDTIVFCNLSECLSHQMTFYDAIYIALPYVLKLYEQKQAEQDIKWQFLILSEIGSCIATDVLSDKSRAIEKEILDSYAAALKQFKQKAVSFLAENMQNIKEMEYYEKIFFCTALTALLGERETAFCLLCSSWENVCTFCDECKKENEEIYFDEPETLEPITPAPSVIGQWDKKSFENTYVWLSNLLYLLGNEKEANMLSYFYGTYRCSHCGNEKPFFSFIQNYFL